VTVRPPLWMLIDRVHEDIGLRRWTRPALAGEFPIAIGPDDLVIVTVIGRGVRIRQHARKVVIHATPEARQ